MNYFKIHKETDSRQLGFVSLVRAYFWSFRLAAVQSDYDLLENLLFCKHILTDYSRRLGCIRLLFPKRRGLAFNILK